MSYFRLYNCAGEIVLRDRDILDSRDLIEAAAYIETLDEEQREEGDDQLLAGIGDLEEQGIEDWQYGASLIRDSYFVRYAQELAEDIGAVNYDAEWPLTCIDWEAAANALKMDYTTVEFNGDTYYVR